MKFRGYIAMDNMAIHLMNIFLGSKLHKYLLSPFKNCDIFNGNP